MFYCQKWDYPNMEIHSFTILVLVLYVFCAAIGLADTMHYNYRLIFLIKVRPMIIAQFRPCDDVISWLSSFSILEESWIRYFSSFTDRSKPISIWQSETEISLFDNIVRDTREMLRFYHCVAYDVFYFSIFFKVIIEKDLYLLSREALDKSEGKSCFALSCMVSKE